MAPSRGGGGRGLEADLELDHGFSISLIGLSFAPGLEDLGRCVGLGGDEEELGEDRDENHCRGVHGSSLTFRRRTLHLFAKICLLSAPAVDLGEGTTHEALQGGDGHVGLEEGSLSGPHEAAEGDAV